MTGVREAPQQWGQMIRSVGGIVRYPHGLHISFQFWPYEVKDWLPALDRKGGAPYGTISRGFYANAAKPDSDCCTLQDMLAAAKAQGVKLNVQLNCVGMFNGQDFVYVKTLPEERMKRENPLDSGTFCEQNLAAIVSNNATLVDYILRNGYENTVASFEMDNERWDMKGEEYALVVARHVSMVKSKIPKAKVIVCLGELASYSADPDNNRYVRWSKALVAKLAELGMTGSIDYFAPHLYPYLSDTAIARETSRGSFRTISRTPKSRRILSAYCDKKVRSPVNAADA